MKNNVYERLVDIMTLLYENDGGITPNILAKKHNVDVTIILEDLKFLCEEDSLQFLVEPVDEDLDTDVFLTELFEGKHNDVEILSFDEDEDMIFSIQLSAFEQFFLHEFIKEYNGDDNVLAESDFYV